MARGAAAMSLVSILDSREELVALLLAEQGLAPAPLATIPVATAETGAELAPLSFEQEALWLEEKLAPEARAYQQVLRFGLAASLDARELHLVLGAVLQRHAILRTCFPLLDGAPRQLVRPAAEPRWQVVDLRALPVATASQVAARLLPRFTLAPFALERDVPLRFAQVLLAEGGRELWIGLHHILCDEASLGLFLAELEVEVRRGRDGLAPPPALPLQFGDFARWQRQELEAGRLAAGLEALRSHLEPLPARLELPTDRPRGREAGGTAATFECHLPEPLAAALGALAQQEKAPELAVFWAAFAWLLARQSDAAEVLVGTTLTRRDRPELEGLIGFFVNTLPLVLRPDPRQRWRELVRAARADVLLVLAHQDVPLGWLVRELAPARDPARSPLFDVVLTLQNAPPRAAAGESSAVWWPLPWEPAATPFELALDLSRDERRGYCLRFEYRSDLFDATTVARLGRSCRGFLERAVAAPEARLCELASLDPAERHQLLRAWGEPTSPEPRFQALGGSLLQCAAARPEAVAITRGETSLSYGALAAGALQLACAFKEACASEEAGELAPRWQHGEEPLPVMLEGGAELVMAWLAALLLGVPFAALDPRDPPARLESTLQRAGARRVLTREAWHNQVPPTFKVVVLEQLLSATETADAESIATRAEVLPEQAAALFFTSGSTGEPKAVVLTQRGLALYVEEMARRLSLGAGDCWLQLARLGFDVVLEEVLPVLLAGGRVVFRADDRLGAPLELSQEIELSRVTALELSGAYFNEWLRAHRQAASPLPECLRQVVVGCESPAPEGLSAWPWGRAELWHVFGLTEVTVTSTLHRAASYRPTPRLPIGRPVVGNTVRVLDALLLPLPIGAVGELCLAGTLLARGYTAAPAATAARFVPDPDASGPGQRLYRTGDRVRFLASGELEHLGRLDRQVKVRGVRVELGEVEAALLAEEQVALAAVLPLAVRQGGAVDRLWAFVEPTAGATLSGLGLRARLAHHLPAALVPAEVTVLEGLPRTATGKVDRRELERLLATRDLPDNQPLSDWRTPFEELVAQVWSEVLDRPVAARQDDFFVLGGHSLAAIRVLARLREWCGVELSLAALFQAPRLEALAQAVAAGLAGAGSPRSLPRQVRQGDLPLSPAQLRLWMFDRLEPGRSVYNVPLAVWVRGRLHPEALVAAFAEMARRHEVLRGTFHLVDDRPVERLSPHARPGFAVIDLGALSGSQQQATAEGLAEAESSRPFDLTTGPLLRVLVLRLEATRHGLVVTLHHIVCDDRTMELLLAELAALYPAFVAGRPSPLPEPSRQYGDYVAWQLELEAQGVFDAQLDYWRRTLEAAPSSLSLPYDSPRPSSRSFRGGWLELRLASELSQELRALARRLGLTHYLLFLSAWKAFLYRLTGDEQLVVGSGVANRDHSELEEVFGFFINTVAIRSHGGLDLSFAALSGQVRTRVLEAHAHKDVPFERVLEQLGEGWDLESSPLFQVMFEFENAARGAWTIEGLELERLDSSTRTAKFDLVLGMSEGESGFVGNLEYALDRFTPRTVAAMAQSFVALLGEIVAHPEARILELGGSVPPVRMPSGLPAHPGPESFSFEAQSARSSS